MTEKSDLLYEFAALVASIIRFFNLDFAGGSMLLDHNHVSQISFLFRFRPGMRARESKIDQSVLEAVAELEKLGFTPYMLSVPKYNLRMLKGKVQEVKSILSKFTYPYIRRIAGAHGHFTIEDYKKWLGQADIERLAPALGHLAQLNQTKVYLLWKNPDMRARSLRGGSSVFDRA